MDTPLRKADLFALSEWTRIKKQYYGQLTFAKSGEMVEEYGVREHRLHERIPFLEEFWRCHVAPATNRPDDTFLSDGIDPVISLIAERSYEVFCNVVDAMDELASVRKGPPVPPRYRSYLNVLRFSGDALQLFSGLVFVIQGSKPYQGNGLATILGNGFKVFDTGEWKSEWNPEREKAIWYRNMLVHHGRPWFFFQAQQEYKSAPFILRAEQCMPDPQTYPKTHPTWEAQMKMFKSDPSRFTTLHEACEETVDLTTRWLNRAYQRVVEKLEPLLDNPNYRKLWGWP